MEDGVGGGVGVDWWSPRSDDAETTVYFYGMDPDRRVAVAASVSAAVARVMSSETEPHREAAVLLMGERDEALAAHLARGAAPGEIQEVFGRAERVLQSLKVFIGSAGSGDGAREVHLLDLVLDSVTAAATVLMGMAEVRSRGGQLVRASEIADAAELGQFASECTAVHGDARAILGADTAASSAIAAMVAPPGSAAAGASVAIQETDDEGKPLKPFRILLNGLCAVAEARRLSMHSDCVVAPHVHPRTGRTTYSYQDTGDFEEWAQGEMSQMRNPPLWDAWTDIGGGKLDKLFHMIQSTAVQNFPRIELDRHVFSFDNGVYVTDKNAFFSTDPADPSYATLATNPVMACKYHDAPFNAAWTTCANPMYDIPTPNFDRIFALQGYALPERKPDGDTSTCTATDPGRALFQMYALIGRVLYKLGEEDNLQVVPFVWGMAKTGKSIIAAVVAAFFSFSSVGILGNTHEKTFGTSQLVDKMIVVGPEIGDGLTIDQNTFQSMVSGDEPVSFPRKFLNPVQLPRYDIPMFLCGNKPPPFVDNQGSVTRRFAGLYFPNVLPADKVDTQLKAKIMGEIGAIICKCNRAYKLMMADFARMGGSDFWAYAAPAFVDSSTKMLMNIEPLIGFVESPEVELDDYAECHEADLRTRFQQWAKENQITKLRPWKDSSDSVFGNKGITRILRRGQPTTLRGIKLTGFGPATDAPPPVPSAGPTTTTSPHGGAAATAAAVAAAAAAGPDGLYGQV
jgi:hypothetical protein